MADRQTKSNAICHFEGWGAFLQFNSNRSSFGFATKHNAIWPYPRPANVIQVAFAFCALSNDLPDWWLVRLMLNMCGPVWCVGLKRVCVAVGTHLVCIFAHFCSTPHLHEWIIFATRSLTIDRLFLCAGNGWRIAAMKGLFRRMDWMTLIAVLTHAQFIWIGNNSYAWTSSIMHHRFSISVSIFFFFLVRESSYRCIRCFTEISCFSNDLRTKRKRFFLYINYIFSFILIRWDYTELNFVDNAMDMVVFFARFRGLVLHCISQPLHKTVVVLQWWLHGPPHIEWSGLRAIFSNGSWLGWCKFPLKRITSSCVS